MARGVYKRKRKRGMVLPSSEFGYKERWEDIVLNKATLSDVEFRKALKEFLERYGLCLEPKR